MNVHVFYCSLANRKPCHTVQNTEIGIYFVQRKPRLFAEGVYI